MKIKFVLLALVLFVLSSKLTNAQTAKPYTEGSVWVMSYIKLKPNMGDDYLKSLATTWVKVHEEAKKQGIILSYKVLSGMAANPDDYDVALLVEYKNLASIEGQDEKWDAIEKTVVGGEDAMKTMNQGRVNMRDIYGTKMLRELDYK